MKVIVRIMIIAAVAVIPVAFASSGEACDTPLLTDDGLLAEESADTVKMIGDAVAELTG